MITIQLDDTLYHELRIILIERRTTLAREAATTEIPEVLQICNRQLTRLNDIQHIIDRAGDHKPTTPP